jgi:hypothetical protein
MKKRKLVRARLVMTRAELAKIRDAAAWAGQTPGKWVRTRLLCAAKEEIPFLDDADTPNVVEPDSPDED